MTEDKKQPESADTGRKSKVTSDQSLIQRLRAGEQTAAMSLYQRYAHRLKGLVNAQLSRDLARRVEVDDIVQSVFRTFFRRAGEGQYHVPAGDDLWKLFLVICLNKVRSQSHYHFAAKRDVRTELGSEGGEIAFEQIGTENSAAEAFLSLVVDEALSHLPQPHRQIVQLRLEGYEVAEIAQKIQRSKRTTERILQQIRAQLEALLKQDDEDELK